MSRTESQMGMSAQIGDVLSLSSYNAHRFKGVLKMVDTSSSTAKISALRKTAAQL